MMVAYHFGVNGVPRNKKLRAEPVIAALIPDKSIFVKAQPAKLCLLQEFAVGS